MGDEWKDLYNKPQELTALPADPVLYYNDLVIDHFTNPRNVGELENPDAEVVVGDPTCGDQMKVAIKVVDNKIFDIKFKSYGCPGAIATSSMLTELAKGKSITEAQELTDDDVIIALGGVPARKRHCSLLGVTGLLAAITDYARKVKVSG